METPGLAPLDTTDLLDPAYSDGSIVAAAMAYLLCDKTAYPSSTHAAALWPWDRKSFLPSTDPDVVLMQARSLLDAELRRRHLLRTSLVSARSSEGGAEPPPAPETLP